MVLEGTRLLKESHSKDGGVYGIEWVKMLWFIWAMSQLYPRLRHVEDLSDLLEACLDINYKTFLRWLVSKLR